MNRFPLAFPCGFLALFGLALARVSQDVMPITTAHVAGPVHMLAGAGGNVGCSAGPDGVLLIDSQYAGQVPGIEAAFGELSEAPLRFLVNTHWHGDHTGGNAAFGGRAAIVAHANVRRRLSMDQELARGSFPKRPDAALPAVTFEERLTLHFNGEEIQLLHFPAGHTDGDLVVWFAGSRVLHAGDLFFEGRFPFVDLDSGGSLRGTARAVASLLEWLPAEAKVIPGHGELTTRAGLEEYARMLGDCIALVERALAAGKSLEDMRAEELFAPYETLSWNFISTDRFLEACYRELSGESR